MPWTTKSDVARHNKAAAASPAKTRQFQDVANSVLAKTGDEGRALREASGAVRDHPAKRMHGDGKGHFSGH